MELKDVLEFISSASIEDSIEIEEATALRIEDLQAANREPIPDFGSNIPFDEFIDAVRHGGFCSSDGHGYYATETEQSQLPFRFWDLRDEEKCQKYGFTHVMWFNK